MIICEFKVVRKKNCMVDIIVYCEVVSGCLSLVGIIDCKIRDWGLNFFLNFFFVFYVCEKCVIIFFVILVFLGKYRSFS